MSVAFGLEERSDMVCNDRTFCVLYLGVTVWRELYYSVGPPYRMYGCLGDRVMCFAAPTVAPGRTTRELVSLSRAL